MWGAAQPGCVVCFHLRSPLTAPSGERLEDADASVSPGPVTGLSGWGPYAWKGCGDCDALRGLRTAGLRVSAKPRAPLWLPSGPSEKSSGVPGGGYQAAETRQDRAQLRRAGPNQGRSVFFKKINATLLTQSPQAHLLRTCASPTSQAHRSPGSRPGPGPRCPAFQSAPGGGCRGCCGFTNRPLMSEAYAASVSPPQGEAKLRARGPHVPGGLLSRGGLQRGTRGCSQERGQPPARRAESPLTLSVAERGPPPGALPAPSFWAGTRGSAQAAGTSGGCRRGPNAPHLQVRRAGSRAGPSAAPRDSRPQRRHSPGSRLCRSLSL